MSDDSARLLGRTPSSYGAGPNPHRNRRRLIWTIVIVLAITGLVLLLRPSGDAKSKHAGMGGPMPVAATVAVKGDIGVTLSALGTVTPLVTAIVHTQIAGILMQLGFTEGQMVKKGDFLAQIDPRPYQAQLQQQEGQLAKDQAALKDAEIDLKRYQTLVQQDSLARQTLDTQLATVHQDEGAIKTDEALVNNARLNLIYCHITSPATGRVGLRQVDVGNLVQSSDANGIVVVTQLEPISVIFVLPEDDITRILQRVHAGATLTVTAYDRSQTTKLAEGTLATLDNQIDTTTGTVKLRANFDNKDELLFPNQFVNVQLLVDTLHDATVIPTAAIQRGAPGTFVYLVKPDNTVSVQVVKLGPVDGQNVAITEGLNPGDKVVIDGADKLKDGAQITLPAEQPSPPDGTKSDADKAAKGKGSHHRDGDKPAQ